MGGTVEAHSRGALDRAAKKKQVRRVIKILNRFQIEFEGQGLPPPGIVTECLNAAEDEAGFQTLLEVALGEGAAKTIQGNVLAWLRIEA